MVVEHRQPRRRGVRRLQIRIGLVLRVALSVVGQRHRLGPGVVTNVAAGDRGLARRILVLVVPQVHNEIRVFVGEPTIGGKPALFVVRARREAHRHRRQRPRRGRRPGATRGRDVTGGAEPVEVVGAWPQAGQLDVHTMRQFRCRRGDSALNDTREAVVGRDLPLHVDDLRGHAAETVVGQRVRREPGPDHGAVGIRFARRHPEGERIDR